jgi:hypothetical protein
MLVLAMQFSRATRRTSSRAREGREVAERQMSRGVASTKSHISDAGALRTQRTEQRTERPLRRTGRELSSTPTWPAEGPN